MTTGYSDTPLVEKLGIKSGYTIKLVNQPNNYFELISDLPVSVQIEDDPSVKKDFIHFFTKQSPELEQGLKEYKNEIKQSGMIWVSWPKKASRVLTDITEDVVRDKALKAGLVDVKVCAVDTIWSGLKLVIPVKDRPKK